MWWWDTQDTQAAEVDRLTTEDIYIRDRLWKEFLARQPIMVVTDKEVLLRKLERSRRYQETIERRRAQRQPEVEQLRGQQ